MKPVNSMVMSLHLFFRLYTEFIIRVNLRISAFNPIGGGGGATFEKVGIPRIEYDPALIASSLAGMELQVMILNLVSKQHPYILDTR